MKRFHVHVHVDDLARSIEFYAKLFDLAPVRSEPDYAKWMLEDPRLHFAISTGGDKCGLDHVGIESDTHDELVALKRRAEAVDMTLLDVGDTTCCYTRSDRYWVTDPQGVAWEHFRDLAQIDGATCRVLCMPADSGRRAAAKA
jgi:catechol 2,3-dioxygenase-like lactoylglutathione lyase family enzyme